MHSSHVLTSPLHLAYGDASWTSAVRRPTRPERAQAHAGNHIMFLQLLSRHHSDRSNVSYSHPRGATSCTSHRCQRSRWWGQKRRTPWNRLWRSQTLARNPAESTRGANKNNSWRKTKERKKRKSDSHLLFSIDDLSLQVCRDHSPSKRMQSILLSSLVVRLIQES